MHNATLKSDRLQRVLKALRIRPMTTREIIREAQVCAVNSVVAELRANGIIIGCHCVSGRKGIYEYELQP